jgi:hypothetical protein
MNYLNSLYQQVFLSISVVLSDCEKQVKVGRPPKVSDLQMRMSTFWVHDGINNNIGCEPSIDGFILSIPRKSLANH